MPEKWILRQYQSLPMRAKIGMSMNRIVEWYEHFNGNVYVSFSGGKDSTVLAHLVHDMYPNVPLVFANTGLEFPEIQAFARKMGAEFIRPKMSFSEVISKYGYPIISKENAEAIYYARRIRNGTDSGLIGGGTTQKQRAGTTGGTKLFTESTASITHQTVETAPISPGGGTQQLTANVVKSTVPECSGGWISDLTTRRDLLLGGNGNLHKRDKNFVRGGIASEEDGPDGRETRSKTDWRNWRRNTVAGVGDFAKETTSIFNKSKWLPLCRDTQFKISHMCCSVMKKGPMHSYQNKNKKYPYLGTMTDESKLREQAWIRHGCNAWEGTNKTSQPMSFWTEQDVLKYILEEGIEIASVYGDIVAVDENGFEYEPYFTGGCTNLKCTGCQRTGCVFCGFGTHLEKGETRFQRLAKTHPRQYEYCMGGGQWVDNPDYDPAAPKMDGEWQNWNPKKIWVPSKEGLGMKHVFDECNAIYGKDFIRYD